MAETLLTVSQAAAFLGVSNHTLIKMERTGNLDPYRTPGGHRRYTQEMLKKHLEENGLPIVGQAQAGGNGLFGAKEASEYLGISRVTLYKIESTGHISPYRTPGGHRRYNFQMLDEYLEKSRELFNNTAR